MSVEPGLVDTNVLVYALATRATQHAVSHGLLQAARHPTVVLYLTSQILCEFYSIITNPRRIASPYSPKEAIYSSWQRCKPTTFNGFIPSIRAISNCSPN
jgi:predicted nucleic acid-binding protein